MVLNFDGEPPPIPPTPVPTGISGAQKVIYDLLVADAELTDRLPFRWCALPPIYDLKRRWCAMYPMRQESREIEGMFYDTKEDNVE